MSWFSKIIRVGGGQVGNNLSDISATVFNTNKNPAQPVAIPEAPVSATTNPQGQMILMGGAALALILLLKGKK